MARPIRSIEIYLPLDDNDGRPIPESKYVSLQQELLNRFGGVTSVQRQFPLQGVWQSGTDIYHDRVVVFGVMDFSEGDSLQTAAISQHTQEPRCQAQRDLRPENKARSESNGCNLRCALARTTQFAYSDA